MPANKTTTQTPADMMDAGQQLLNDPHFYHTRLINRLVHQSLYHPSNPISYVNTLRQLRPDLMPKPAPPIHFHADLRQRLIQIAANGLPAQSLKAIDHLATYFPEALPPKHDTQDEA